MSVALTHGTTQRQLWLDFLLRVAEPVLTAGAIGELHWIINQLDLAGCTATNPVAREFALRLLGKTEN